MRNFEPAALLRNPHAMTLAAAFWPRKYPHLPPTVARIFETEPDTRVRADCHWQNDPSRHPALVLLHGLEGSSDSSYMLGTADKAFEAGFSALRLNQRNCGGTEGLTPTLYNSGLSGDVRAVVRELIEKDHVPEIFVAGFSMGGNLVLKMAAEFGDAAPPELRAVVGICPSCDLGACADAIDLPHNRIYEWHFVKRLKRRMRSKAELFPGRFPLNGLERVRTVRQFDDAITAKFCGFRDANDYYEKSSSLNLLGNIRVPTLLLTSQDDPMIPFRSFEGSAPGANPHIEFQATRHGGHCAFISRERGENRFWAEARIVEFCSQHSRLAVSET
ncbi:MAG TPA: alpha/beta fold hydrolase [Candidatus Acidoferrales bacterium]|nr:alpha/beta fold hydrolase [Candidatus Acidoferrales bacterium]